MKLRNLLLTVAAILPLAVGAQMQVPPVPNDPEVRIGKLDNGLTYYIRHNNWPENRANFYIAQKVGSLQEEESQRGLAHFLEHMCFNGTENFPGNSVLRYCESIGVQFGGDLNAYTSIEETVYNIDNVPTDKPSNIDSCLLILRDWADGLLLEPEEIDKERGVIHEEWRLRTSAQMRMLERNLEELYPGSKYGRRFPIGTMEVVDNFKYQELRDYYERWYHPSNQGIIVVGNVDVDDVEQKIKNLFSPIANPADAEPIVSVEVPDNEEPIVVIDHDKEQTDNVVEISIKQEAFPKELRGTMMFVLNEMANAAVGYMLDNRFTEAAQEPDCPFTFASGSIGEYMYSSTKDALDVYLQPKSLDQAASALEAAYKVVRQAAEYGFTATEYARFKQEYESQIEKQVSNKEKTNNSYYYRKMKANFLMGDAMPSIDDYYMMVQQLWPAMPLEALNESFKQSVPSDNKNMVILAFCTEQEGDNYPTEASLLEAIDRARKAQIEAYVDNVKSEPLMTELPTPGTIVDETSNEKFGYTELKLSNGATVVLKKTDYKLDQVLFHGLGKGGKSTFGIEDRCNLQIFDDAIDACGLGNFSNTELQKALAGKVVSASLKMGGYFMNAEGSSTPKDLETMLQLNYLYFTALNKDQKAFDNVMNLYKTQLKNADISPEIAFSDSVQATIYGHNPLLARLKYDDLGQVSYDRIIQIAQQRTHNAQDWCFYIVGNYDESTIRQLVCTYIASLPATDKNVPEGHRMAFMQEGVVDNVFKRKQETPKAIAIMLWNNETMPATLENQIRADMAGQILSMVYLKKIREDASAAYSVGASGAGSVYPDYHALMIQAYCPMSVDKVDIAMDILAKEVPAMELEIDESMLVKVKEYMLKHIQDQQKTNGYWYNAIQDYRWTGFDSVSGYADIVASQTTDTLKAFMKEFRSGAGQITVAMLPE